MIEKLPKGSSNAIREVRTSEDLQNLKRWLTEHGVDGYNRYKDPAKGSWTDLPDGSKIGERNAAGSTGRNALDVDIPGPNGNEYWKIHINPESGGVPDLPGVQAAPVDPAPTARAPAESGPLESFAGGGPAGIPPGLHLVHPPGTIDHGIPILGEDDPGEDLRDFKH